MRIALVSEHASPLACLGGVDAGGQNVHVAALATALGARGHQITVYTRADAPALPRQVPFAPGVLVEHIPAGPAAAISKDELPQYMPEFGAMLSRRWADHPPDVVHAHFWMSGLASLQATAGTEVPVLQTFHALGAVKRRWQGDADSSPDDRIEMESRILRTADRIIATCRDEVAELTALGGGAPIDVVPCGVDTATFRPRPTSSRSRPRVLVLGRLVPRKGVEDAIRAMPDIPAAELLVVGGPDTDGLPLDPEARRLIAVAIDLGVADRVTFAGRAAHAELPAVISSADVVVAAPWYEPFGIVPLEAMACGVPVVGTAVGGLLDSVEDGVTGLLVPPGRPREIAVAVNTLLADPQRRAAMGQAGRVRVEQRYGWDSIALRTEQSYRRALHNGRRHVPAEPSRSTTATAGAGR